MPGPEAGRGDRLVELAGTTVDRLSELFREHVELARMQVGAELRVTVERSAWSVAATVVALVAALLLVAGLFDLAGALVSSVGARLVILAVACAAASYVVALRGSTLGRRRGAPPGGEGGGR